MRTASRRCDEIEVCPVRRDLAASNRVGRRRDQASARRPVLNFRKHRGLVCFCPKVDLQTRLHCPRSARTDTRSGAFRPRFLALPDRQNTPHAGQRCRLNYSD
jgi:hypothetical protein